MLKEPRHIFRAILALIAVFLLYRISKNGQEQKHLQEFTGQTMGTITYSVKVMAEDPLPIGFGIDSVLKAFNQSLSTYVPSSEISKFNATDTLLEPSDLFTKVLLTSKEVHTKTDGAFDPTIGPLVNAWGFGPDRKPLDLDSIKVDSLLQRVDFDKIQAGRQLISKESGMYIDFSAIAKGYAVDLVAKYVESFGVEDYFVEIGGEVRTKGINKKQEIWKVGVDHPLVAKDERKTMAIIALENRAVATSGNYRNYYKKDSVLIAHIIDPRTGYPASGDLLSASVFATDCMEADAYATALMVLGLEKSRQLIEKNPSLDAVLIYQEEGTLKSYISSGIEASVVQMNLEL